MSKQTFNIKKQGNFFVAFDTEDKKRSYGKINIKTGKFVGDTRCMIALHEHLESTMGNKTRMEKRITISYHWITTDYSKIRPHHEGALEESAQERVFEMTKEGYTSGELFDNIRMTDEDGEDGIEYTGWWEMTTETVE